MALASLSRKTCKLLRLFPRGDVKSLAGVNSIVPTYQCRLWYRSGPWCVYTDKTSMLPTGRQIRKIASPTCSDLKTLQEIL